MNIFDLTESLGLIAIDYRTAPKTIKMLNDEDEAGDWVVICRNDMKEEGDILAARLTDYSYQEYPFGNFKIFITHYC